MQADVSARMPSIVIFDGVCNLCTRSVRFILEHEAAPTLVFASVQSPAGARLMRELGLDPQDVTTFVLVEDGVGYTQSDAALRVAQHLRMPWGLAATILSVVPRRVRDDVYDMIARNRYRWFGRRNACIVPSAELAARFMNE